ncbi:MAG: 3-hydroxyacyl-[acyl-carrier-protein] dehydratase FabZ [Chlamydiales bacterium 38-26]|nr:3-hydroxyacyl-ACP dehydratase FabZ [Chlamydiales bacterium]OJV07905.1 MAG: 3-hydroxyacyl-[acyl-carrier-protein] dehydratase FabZ [Chlamydiales bacterium 38-26]
MESTSSDNSKTLDIKQILKILPHRYPFLLVDRILDYNLDQGMIIGQKNLTFNEPFFQGHFPNAPIMPGVLILEALAQVGSIIFHLKGHDKLAVFLTINNAKFRNPVRPGDILTLKIENIRMNSKAGRMDGFALVNDKIAAEAEIGFALVDESLI